eukprot:scaffold16732_cov173-Skeletonema_dohrnii-CCMP3373.AAC.2
MAVSTTSARDPSASANSKQSFWVGDHVGGRRAEKLGSDEVIYAPDREEIVKSLSAPSALRRRGGGGGDHHHDGGHTMKLGKKLQWLSDSDYATKVKKRKKNSKLGRQYASFTSCKSSTIIGGALAAAAALILFLLL